MKRESISRILDLKKRELKSLLSDIRNLRVEVESMNESVANLEQDMYVEIDNTLHNPELVKLTSGYMYSVRQEIANINFMILQHNNNIAELEVESHEKAMEIRAIELYIKKYDLEEKFKFEKRLINTYNDQVGLSDTIKRMTKE